MIGIRSTAASAVVLLAVAGCSSSVGVSISTPPVPSASTSQQVAELTAGTVAHRLNLSGVVVYNATTDPNHLLGRQNGYTSKASWGNYANDNLPEGSGGSIEVFPTLAGAQERLTELQAFTAPFGDGYDYLVGTAILRLGSAYTPNQAYALGAKFKAIVGG